MEDDYSFLCLLHFFLSESALLRIVMWKLDPKVLCTLDFDFGAETKESHR
jgi:hypothetical protein